MAVVNLREVFIYPQVKFKNKREQAKYNKLVRDVKRHCFLSDSSCAVFKVRLKFPPFPRTHRVSQRRFRLSGFAKPQNDTETIFRSFESSISSLSDFRRLFAGLPPALLLLKPFPSVRPSAFRFLPASRLTFRPRSPKASPLSFLPRKEVIQPHLPIRLPCYDFTPVIGLTLDGCLLAVSSPASGAPNSHGVTGGVYKARERIHRSILICDY